MNQEAIILLAGDAPTDAWAAKPSGEQVHQSAWRSVLVLTSQPLCDFCHRFTPALIYSELEVALAHQVATKSPAERGDPERCQESCKEAFGNTEAVEISAAFLVQALLEIPLSV